MKRFSHPLLVAAMTVGLLTQTQPAAAMGGSCGVTALAHRGAHVHYDENTVASLEGAYRRHAHSEHDLWITKDGYFVVIHDETVDRTTDGTGRVNDMTLAEIKELNTTPHGDKVPTLTELLAAASDNPNQLLNLELKGSGWTADESVLELKRVIESSGVLDRAFVSPPGEGLLVKLGQMVPEVRTTWKPDATVEVTTDKAQELSVDAVMARLRQLDANVVRQLHSQNLYAWSRLNNREVVWEKLDSVGVDAVLTDRPAAFLTWCNNQ